MSFNRLKKIISDSCLLSRRKSDLAIKKGRVTLFEHPVQDLQRMSISSIKLDGLKELEWLELNTNEWVSIIN